MNLKDLPGLLWLVLIAFRLTGSITNFMLHARQRIRLCPEEWRTLFLVPPEMRNYAECKNAQTMHHSASKDHERDNGPYDLYCLFSRCIRPPKPWRMRF